MTTKCSGEASRHYQCTVNNDGWTVEDSVSYSKIIESFNIFNMRKPTIHNSEEMEGKGTAITNKFVPNKRYK